MERPPDPVRGAAGGAPFRLCRLPPTSPLAIGGGRGTPVALGLGASMFQHFQVCFCF